MSGIQQSFKNLSARVQANVKIKKSNVVFYIALILVIALAIGVRVVPIIRGDMLIKAFDPWIQFYNSEYLAEHGLYEYFTWHDLKSWNFTGGVQRANLYPGLIFTSAAIFKILTFFGVPITLYEVCYFFPAFMGGMTVLAMFFLGKEVLDEKAGLVAAFFLALSPGHIQRTVAGFFDNETIGVFAILMVFLFFVKALKSGKLSHSVIGGIFLGYLTLSWGGAQFVIYVIPIVCFFLIILNKYNKNVLIAYAGIEGTGILISSLKYGFKFNDFLFVIDQGGMLFFTILLVLYHLFYQNKNNYREFYEKFMTIFKWVLIPAVIIFLFLVYTFPEILPLGLGSKFLTIINPLIRENLSFLASVAEHMPSSWSIIYYNTLIPLMLIPLGIYFCIRRYNAIDIFLIVLVLITFYFVGSMVRIVLVFAPVAALVGAYGLVNVLKIFGSYLKQKKVGFSRKRRRLSRKKSMMGNAEIYAVFLIVGFLCTAQVIHTTDVATTQYSYSQLKPGGSLNDWTESLDWMRTNLEGDTVVVSWWDYGYWLTPLGNVTTVCDNGNYNVKVNGLVGMSMMQTNEIYSAEILKMLGAEYVLVYFGFFYDGLGGDEGKWQWMLRICNDYYSQYKEMGLEKPNWEENSVFSESEYVNRTSGKFKEKWFQSQLAKLMLQYEPVSGQQFKNNFLYKNLINKMDTRSDEGETYRSYVPTDDNQVNYQTDVFSLAHRSTYGLVKLYEMDYTPIESSFVIKDPKMHDNGYGMCHIKNTGEHDLTISKASINGKEYTFEMADDNTLSVGEQDTLLIDTTSGETKFKKDDTVKFNITADVALEEKQGTYTFSNATSNLFVKEANENIQIVREDSEVIHNEATGTDNVYLKVKNTGNCGTLLDNDAFYVNSTDTGFGTVEYLSGSEVLEPGTSAYVKLSDTSVSFSPIGSFYEVGTSTMNDISDATIFSAKLDDEYYDYDLTILPQERIISPELSTQTDSGVRNHISINNTDDSYAYTLEDGSTTIYLKVKNTGDIPAVLNKPDIFDENGTEIDPDLVDWTPIDGSHSIKTGREEMVEINVSSGVFGVNDEVGVSITSTYDGDLVASDVGYLYTMNNSADLEILKQVNGFNTSVVYNNTEGSVLVKNIGNKTLNLDSILINGESPSSSNIDEINTLGIQETAVITFNVNETAIGPLNVGDLLTIKVLTDDPQIFDEIEVIVKEDSA